MKRILILAVDLAIVFGSIFLSYLLLGKNDFIRDYEKNIQAFYIIAPAIGSLYVLFMYTFGLYNSIRYKLSDVVYTVFLTSISLTIGIMATCFFVRGGAMAFPRSVIFLSAVFYWVLLSCWQVTVWKLYKKNHGTRSITIIGPKAVELASILHVKYKDFYTIRCVCDEDGSSLASWLKESEEIFLSAGVSNKIREMILLSAAEYGTAVNFVPEYQDVSVMSSFIYKTDDIPTFHINSLGLSFEERVVKRLVDLLLGTIGLLLALPFFLLAGILVKLDGGPLFYIQERLTRNGKIFKVLKFRTMTPDAEKYSGPVLAGENDPRITRIGHFMRATRLDEIPQIFNILKGDMSIVGPRPERPFFTEQFEKTVPHYRQRLKVKAGLTGLAQVEGKYNTSFDNKLRYDLLYIGNYSLFHDFIIILQTIKILFLKASTEGVVSNTESKEIFASTQTLNLS